MSETLSAIRRKAVTQGIKVLFIGDSLTYYHDMPCIFAHLCEAAGKKVTVSSLTKGGTGICAFREDATLWQSILDRIASDDWDIIICQPNRNTTVMTEFFPDHPAKELAAARELVSIIRDSGAVPVIYSSFGVLKGSVTRQGKTKVMDRREHTALVTAFNAAVAQDTGCLTVYVGPTFDRVYAENSGIDLYFTDRVHPSVSGSYLIANDFYCVLFGESPEDIPDDGGLDATQARYLRKTSAMLQNFRPEKIADIQI